MLDEMRAFEKNETWELVDLPQGKQPVGCKWVLSVKHTPEPFLKVALPQDPSASSS